MTYKELEPKLKEGHWGKLPNYNGYFKWNFSKSELYFQNGGYIKTDLDREKGRNDWICII